MNMKQACEIVYGDRMQMAGQPFAPVSGLDGWCVGQKVWTSVSVGGVSKRMAQGVIVAVHSGYCDVDVMSLHGGAPWIVQQTNSALEAV